MFLPKVMNTSNNNYNRHEKDCKLKNWTHKSLKGALSPHARFAKLERENAQSFTPVADDGKNGADRSGGERDAVHDTRDTCVERPCRRSGHKIPRPGDSDNKSEECKKHNNSFWEKVWAVLVYFI